MDGMSWQSEADSREICSDWRFFASAYSVPFASYEFESPYIEYGLAAIRFQRWLAKEFGRPERDLRLSGAAWLSWTKEMFEESDVDAEKARTGGPLTFHGEPDIWADAPINHLTTPPEEDDGHGHD